MKNLISDEKISVEPKGKECYQIKNVSNFIILSNDDKAIQLEGTDRRYFCLRMNLKYRCDREFFKKVREKWMTQDFANHFYTYFLRLNKSTLVHPNKIPMTKLKRSITEHTIPAEICFLTDLKILVLNKSRPSQAYCMLSADLYAEYRKWCEANGIEYIINNSSFAKNVKSYFDKTTLSKGYTYYFVDSITLSIPDEKKIIEESADDKVEDVDPFKELE